MISTQAAPDALPGTLVPFDRHPRRLDGRARAASPATSKTHVSRAMLKLGAHDRAQLVVFAFHAGLAVPRAETAAPHALVLEGVS